MDFWNWIGGLIQIRLTSADVSGGLTEISRAGIMLFNCVIIDELNAVFSVKRTEYRRLKSILAIRGDQVVILKKQGLFWKIKKLGKRPVLTIGVVILLVLHAYLPERVLFVQVEGNTSVPAGRILEEAEKHGLGFGTSRREVRSEKIKNALLEAIPQLQWIGVNTKGCVAVISVRERQVVQEMSKPNVVTSIVAARDGVVLTCTVTRGNPLCRVGQAVKAGEVLISGYTDCGLTIQATRAEGEVYAKTERSATLVYPRQWQTKTRTGKEITRYAFIFGKKRINLYNGSGILDTTCDKMYEEWFLTLPGGFVLPISVIKETSVESLLSNERFDATQANRILSTSSKAYLLDQMIAGEILTSEEVFTECEFVYQTEGKYACQEMIGQVRKEEIYGNHR